MCRRGHRGQPTTHHPVGGARAHALPTGAGEGSTLARSVDVFTAYRHSLASSCVVRGGGRVCEVVREGAGCVRWWGKGQGLGGGGGEGRVWEVVMEEEAWWGWPIGL